jgi:hypothetical protein
MATASTHYESETQVSLRHGVAFWACTITGTVALFAGTTAFVAARNLFDARAFGQRAEKSLADPGVAAYVSSLVADSVIKSRPDLIAIRPILEASTRGLVSARPFQVLVGAAATRAHQAAFSEGGRRVVLSIPDLQILIHDTLEQASPALAAKIPQRVNTTLASLGDGHRTQYLIDLWRTGNKLRWIWKGLLPLGLALLVAALWVSTDRRRGLVRVGIALIVMGLLLSALVPAGAMATDFLPQPPIRGLVRGLWLSYFGDLVRCGLFFVGLGILLSAGTSSLLESVDPLARLRWAGRLMVTVPASVGARLGWSAGWILLGLAAIWHPLRILAGAVVIAGAVAAYCGVLELFRLFLGRLEQREHQLAAHKPPRWRLTASIVAGLLLLAVGTWLLFRNSAIEPVEAQTVTACNGYAELCDKHLDEVAFAGAHNAMSNQDAPGWMFPQQEASMVQQLRDGVRALLIDVHYGFPGGARIKTDLSEEPNADKMKQVMGQEGFSAAMRIRDRLVGVDESKHGLYFCHGFCELGAYQVEPALRQIRDYLVIHPDEVLILDIEDYVKPQDLAAAFDKAGLTEFVYKGSTGPPWPTLREMITSGQRVACFLESGKPGVSWLRPAYPSMRETPYAFHKPEEFSCRPNRGGDAGSLFLMNHWIDSTPTPKPSNAAVVNAYDFLLARAEQCAQERHHIPNIIAVDFYRTGDLLRVVNKLNGVDQPQTAAATN